MDHPPEGTRDQPFGTGIGEGNGSCVENPIPHPAPAYNGVKQGRSLAFDRFGH